MLLFQIFIIFIFLVIVFSKNYFISKKQKSVLSSSIIIISTFLLLGLFSGYVTYKTSDSMDINLSDLPSDQVNSVKIRRAVCVSAFVVCLVSFGCAFVNFYDPVSTISAVAPQPVVAYPSVLQNMAIGFGLPNDIVYNILDPLAEHLNSKDVSLFLPHFDTLFSNIKNPSVDLSGISPDIKAFFVRTLVRIYDDSDFFEDIVLPGAEVYLESPNLYNKKGLPFVYYTISIILGPKFLN